MAESVMYQPALYQNKNYSMKKTNRNQNMTEQRSRNDESINTSSLPLDRKTEKKEVYRDANLNQPGNKNTKQRYDDYTGTVENGIG